MIKVAGFLAVVIAVSLLFALAPGIDLWASGLFYRPGSGFFLGDWPPVRLLYELVPYLTWAIGLLVLIGGLVAFKRRRPVLGLDRRAAIFLIASLALGPGIVANTILKDNWGRARPSQVEEFGGTKRFTPAPLPADQCGRNCSFVAGHAAMGFYLVSFAFLVREPRRRRLAVAGAMAAGALLGLARIAQGGHFLSDVVFSGLAVTAVAWLLHRAIIVHDGLALLRRRITQMPPWLVFSTVATAVAIAVSITWLDRPIALWFKAHDETLTPVFRVITQLGVATGYLVGAALLFVGLRLAARSPRYAHLAERLKAWSYVPAFVFVAVAASGLAVNLLKTIFGRARPKLLFADTDYLFGWWGFQADYWSFPSGHAATVVALAAALHFLWPRWTPLYAAIAAVAVFSRIFLTAHYLSDVIMGAYVAVVMTAYVKLVFERSGIRLADALAGRAPSAERRPWRACLGFGRTASDNP